MGRGGFFAFRAEMLGVLVRTLVVRSLGMFGSLVVVALVARSHGAAGVGLFALSHSLLLAGGVLVKQGCSNVLIKYLGQGLEAGLVLHLLRWSLLRVVVGSFLLSSILFFFRYWLEAFFQMPGLAPLIGAVAFALPLFGVCLLLSGFFQGLGFPALSGLMEAGFHSLLAAIIFWGSGFFFGGDDLMLIGSSYIASALLLSVLGCVVAAFLFANTYKGEEEAAISVGALIQSSKASSRSFLAMDVSLLAQSVAGVWVVGAVLSSHDLGVFRISEQVGLVVGYSLILVNSIFPARFSALYASSRLLELGVLVKKISLYGCLVAFPFFLFLVFFSSSVLSLLGVEFQGMAGIVRIVASFHFLSVFLGPVVSVLKMTDQDRLMGRISVLMSLVSLFLYFLLSFYFGLGGAVTALGISLVFPKVVAVYFIWTRLGIWVIPILPNLFKVFSGAR